jgi:hypothetical protein
MSMNNPYGFDPSKLDPKVLMELSQMVQSLPRDQLMKMQTLMHNMMAGFDVSKELAEFENTLPRGFREKLMAIMAQSGGAMGAAASGGFGMHSNPSVASGEKRIRGLSDSDGEIAQAAPAESSREMDLHEARMTILRAVADGHMTPEQAEQLLFKDEIR